MSEYKVTIFSVHLGKELEIRFTGTRQNLFQLVALLMDTGASVMTEELTASGD